jgi:hypothetical protein
VGQISAFVKPEQQTACDAQDTKTLALTNQWHIDTKIPAIQAEQVEDDVPPVTAEYVPVTASDKETQDYDRQNANVKFRREEGSGRRKERKRERATTTAKQGVT